MLFTARQSRRLRHLLRPTTERVVVLTAMIMLVFVVLTITHGGAGG